jgi:hypothetical protein
MGVMEETSFAGIERQASEQGGRFRVNRSRLLRNFSNEKLAEHSKLPAAA